MARGSSGAAERAQIAVTVVGDRHDGDRYYVSITGRLSRRDLRRLERACGRAMEHRTPPLEIRLADRAEIDAAAHFFLDSLRARGARVVRMAQRGSGDAPA